MSAGTRATKTPGEALPQHVTIGPHINGFCPHGECTNGLCPLGICFGVQGAPTSCQSNLNGAARYAKAPKERQEYLARLGSPEHRRRRSPPKGPPAVNIFEDLTRAVSEVGSGRRHGAKYFQSGQFGHIAGHSDLGNDQHYGRLGERSVKQTIVDGYNDEESTGSAGRAASICERLERRYAVVSIHESKTKTKAPLNVKASAAHKTKSCSTSGPCVKRRCATSRSAARPD
eukprot:SAG31_NODE_3955_length_3720_cov_1.847556_2_plen_230_part_00